MKRLISGLSLFMGTVIGAGIFSLPYVISRSGFLVGILLMIGLAIVMGILALMYSEVILRTPGNGDRKQYAGYISLYLGNSGRILASLSLFVGLMGSLIAYLLGAGQFLQILLRPVFGGEQWMYILLFFLLCWIPILRGLKVEARLQIVLFSLMIVLILLLALFGIPHVKVDNLREIYPLHALFPFGAILFSLAGSAVIGDLRRLLEGQERLLPKIVIIGQAGSVILYALFVLVFVGIFGQSTSDNPIADLTRIWSNQTGLLVEYFGAFFGVLVIATSYIPISNMISESLHRDYRVNKHLALLITAFFPLLVALTGFTTFITTILFVGAVIGALDGILITETYFAAKSKGKRKPEFALSIPRSFRVIVYVIMLSGAIYQIWDFFAR